MGRLRASAVLACSASLYLGRELWTGDQRASRSCAQIWAPLGPSCNWTRACLGGGAFIGTVKCRHAPRATAGPEALRPGPGSSECAPCPCSQRHSELRGQHEKQPRDTAHEGQNGERGRTPSGPETRERRLQLGQLEEAVPPCLLCSANLSGEAEGAAGKPRSPGEGSSSAPRSLPAWGWRSGTCRARKRR